MTEQETNIVTEKWVLRSDPPARLAGGSFLLLCIDPRLHIIFDTVAGPGELSPNLTFHRDGQSTATISAASLPDEIVDAIVSDVPSHGTTFD